MTNNRHRRGIALLSVLWLVTLMGVLSLGLLALAKNDRIIAHQNLNTAQAEALADAGVFLTIHDLCDVKSRTRIPVDGKSKKLDIDGNSVTITVQDENGKVDINFTAASMLKATLTHAGLQPEESAKLAADIDKQRKAAWQKSRDQQKDTKGPTYIPFQTAEELKQMPGITDAIFQRIKPVATVYAQNPLVQVLTASREVMNILPGATPDRIDRAIADREDKPITAADLGMADAEQGQGGDLSSSRAFTILSNAKIGSTSYTRKAVILITTDTNNPYHVLNWQSVNAE